MKVKITKCYSRNVQLSLPQRVYTMQFYTVREHSWDGGIVVAHRMYCCEYNYEESPV